jgi:hypothetical protein
MKGLADAKVAKAQRRFFKTGKGEYGEGELSTLQLGFKSRWEHNNI